MEDLAAAIKAGHAVLFVGSGATRDGGGCSWTELAGQIESELGIAPQASPQDLFDEACIYSGKRTEAYRLIQKRLGTVVAPAPLQGLLSLDWLTVYTTNYDTAIEEFFAQTRITKPKPMYGAETAVQFGISGEILVFKLMGCRSKEPSEHGEMILSTVDQKKHQRDESEMYAHLDALVSARAVLAIGYSFNDNILLSSIQQIKSLPVNSSLPIYAVFPAGYTSPVVVKLIRLGVKVISVDLASFVLDLQSKVSAVSTEPTIEVRFGGKPFRLPARELRDVLYNLDVVTEDKYRTAQVDVEGFLRGKTSEPAAYAKSLDWQRSIIIQSRKLVDEWRTQHVTHHSNLVINIHGRPGTGRTVVANDLLNYVVEKFPTVGVRTPARSPRLDDVAASQLMNSVLQKAKDAAPFLTVLVDEHAAISDILDFVRQVEPSGSGIVIVRTGGAALPTETLKVPNVEFKNVEVPDRISESEVEAFGSYVAALPANLKPRGWNRDELLYLIRTNPSFIESIYELIDPARRSFRDIVLETYHELSPAARRVVIALSLGSAAGIETPAAILARLLGMHYSDLFDAVDEANKIVKVRQDDADNVYIALYHPRVADVLLAIPAQREDAVRQAKRLVSVANLRYGVEHQFIAEMLVGPPDRDSPLEKVLENNEMLEVFLEARMRGASRLILHHLGRRLRRAHRFKEAIDVLREATDLAEDEYRASERREIVETTLAQVRWFQLKESVPNVTLSDGRVQSIREQLHKARSKTRWNPHSYTIEANILVDLAQRATGPPKIELIAESVELIHDGLKACGGAEPKLVETMKEAIGLVGTFGEREAFSLQKDYGNGYGFFLLFQQAKEAENESRASLMLDRAVASKTPCAPALREAIDRELYSPTPNYNLARTYSDRLFNYQAANPRKVSLTWNDHLQRIVALFGAGDGGLATPHVIEVRKSAPKNIPQPYRYFLRASNSRIEFHGKVGQILSAKAGSIVSTSIPGFRGDLHFNPSGTKVPARLKPGDLVKFHVAFGVYGVTAWDVSPS